MSVPSIKGALRAASCLCSRACLLEDMPACTDSQCACQDATTHWAHGQRELGHSLTWAVPAQYRGRLDVPSITRALCAGFSEAAEPDMCLSGSLQARAPLSTVPGMLCFAKLLQAETRTAPRRTRALSGVGVGGSHRMTQRVHGSCVSSALHGQSPLLTAGMAQQAVKCCKRDELKAWGRIYRPHSLTWLGSACLVYRGRCMQETSTQPFA